MTTNEILEQAQVFASAWSLVGSRFDSGDGIDCANKEEERLGQMIDELVKERGAYANNLDEHRLASLRALEAERDALKDAARLALDALDHVQWKNWRTDKAIAALKAVL